MNTGPLGTPYSTAGKTPQQTPRAVSPTKKRLDELSTRLTTMKQGMTEERSSRLDAIEKEVRALQLQVSELQKNKEEKCRTLSERIDGYEKTLTDSKTVRQDIDDKTQARLQLLSDHVNELLAQAREV